jgi:integrase
MQVRDLAAIDLMRTVGTWDKLAHSTRFARSGALAHVIRLLTDYGAERGLEKLIPKLGKPSPRNVVATNKERESILAASPPHMRCMLHLCSDLAIRSGTAAKICPQHYNPQEHMLTFRTKYARSVTLPVSKPLQVLFLLHSAESHVPYITALNPRGAESESSHRRMFNRIKARLGITRRLTYHDLRRTTAVNAYELTHDLRLVQALLGHKELAHTLYYLDHNTTPVTAEAIEAIRLYHQTTETIQ